jgi:predicted Zn-dependent protease
LALQALRLAHEATPAEPLAERGLYLLLAQVRLARGDATAALQALDHIEPGLAGTSARPPLLLRAQAALLLQRSDQAAALTPLRESTEALQTWLALQPQDPVAWDQLAATSGALGLRLRSLRAGAEARAMLGDLNGAIDRLKAAQAASRSAAGPDFIEASVIDARLRQITALRRQLTLEARAEGRSGRGGDEPPQ